MAENERLPIVLITPYFSSDSSDRQRELDFCLQKNVLCPEISKIVLVIDDGAIPPIESPKITIERVTKRPTYRQWIEISERLGYPHISVLANSDIFFNRAAASFEEALADDRGFIALSRYDWVGDDFKPHPNPHWSQDVWAIRFPAEISKELGEAINIPLGVPRCDNKIAFLFKIHGWRVSNPFAHIVTGHVHQTQIRSYDKKLDARNVGGVAYVHPSALGAASEIDIDIWTLRDAPIKSVKINRSLINWRAESQANSALSQTSAASPKELPPWHESAKLAPSKIPHTASVTQSPKAASAQVSAQHDAIAVPAVLDLKIPIRGRAGDKGDPHFWQYPCLTEKQAFENHSTLDPEANVVERTRTIHTYLALPWATYIDLKAPIDDVIAVAREEVDRNRLVASEYGYELRVHTVCQHYAWDRIHDQFKNAGVTDLHLAHCTSNLVTESRDAFRYHGWPLFAPNIENPLRSRGLRIGTPPQRKAYLASFVGSHMNHYRSTSRLALQEAAAADGGSDILVRLTSLWHFNRAVYDEQVKGHALASAIQKEQLREAESYNRLLSDSIFSLCPDGAGPNSLRLWESLAIGSIPVVIADGWIPPKLYGKDLSDACLFIEVSEIPHLFAKLRSITSTEIEDRMRACFDCYLAARTMTSFGALALDLAEPKEAVSTANSGNTFVAEAPA